MRPVEVIGTAVVILLIVGLGVVTLDNLLDVQPVDSASYNVTNAMLNDVTATSALTGPLMWVVIAFILLFFFVGTIIALVKQQSVRW